jgi:hypothetical protein
MSTGLAWATSDTPVVRVGVFENPPIVSAPAGAQPEGIAIDMLRWVADREGWKLVFAPDAFDKQVERLERARSICWWASPIPKRVQASSSFPSRAWSETGAWCSGMPVPASNRCLTLKASASP